MEGLPRPRPHADAIRDEMFKRRISPDLCELVWWLIDQDPPILSFETPPLPALRLVRAEEVPAAPPQIDPESRQYKLPGIE